MEITSFKKLIYINIYINLPSNVSAMIVYGEGNIYIKLGTYNRCNKIHI